MRASHRVEFSPIRAASRFDPNRHGPHSRLDIHPHFGCPARPVLRVTRGPRGMLNWLRRLLALKKTARPPGAVRLELEALEDRRTPTITYHGGSLMPHVEAQALYLGSDWS